MRDSLARRWEALPGPLQFGISLAVSIAVLWPGHVYLLNQPVGRGLLYAIFWGLLLSLLVVYVTRGEARKRAERDAAARGEDPDG
jgi:hypothetical protein